MQLGSNVRQATIGEVKPGEVFVTNLGRDIVYCMAIQPLEGEGVPGLIAMSPGHPMLDNQMGLLNGSAVRGNSLLVYPGAVFLPSPKPEHIRLNQWEGVPTNSLIGKGTNFAIVAITGRMQKVTYSCNDGSLQEGMINSQEIAIFLSWEIMIEGPGGDPHTLCVFDVSQTR